VAGIAESRARLIFLWRLQLVLRELVHAHDLDSGLN
jgi:hypothetical protein